MQKAAWSLICAGVLFFAVVGYLFGFLVPSRGLSFDLFDDSGAMTTWLETNAGAYSFMYYLYLAQQFALTVAIVAVHRSWRHTPTPGQLARDAATAAGLLAVCLASVGIAALGMAGHTVKSLSAELGPGGDRSALLAAFTMMADTSKGFRLVSESFFGWWLGWFGVAATQRFRHRAWWGLVALGAWTATVSIWKFVDPAISLEDWLAFPISIGLIAAGIGLLRTSDPLTTSSSSPHLE